MNQLVIAISQICAAGRNIGNLEYIEKCVKRRENLLAERVTNIIQSEEVTTLKKWFYSAERNYLVNRFPNVRTFAEVLNLNWIVTDSAGEIFSKPVTEMWRFPSKEFFNLLQITNPKIISLLSEGWEEFVEDYGENPFSKPRKIDTKHRGKTSRETPRAKESIKSPSNAYTLKDLKRDGYHNPNWDTIYLIHPDYRFTPDWVEECAEDEGPELSPYTLPLATFAEAYANGAFPRLNNLSYEQAILQTNAWQAHQEKVKSDKEIAKWKETAKTFKEGVDYKELGIGNSSYRWVQLLSEQALKYEGDINLHCVGTYGKAVASGKSFILALWTVSTNEPNVTVELEVGFLGKELSLVQCEGKKNHKPADRYIEPVKMLIEKGHSGELKLATGKACITSITDRGWRHKLFDLNDIGYVHDKKREQFMNTDYYEKNPIGKKGIL